MRELLRIPMGRVREVETNSKVEREEMDIQKRWFRCREHEIRVCYEICKNRMKKRVCPKKCPQYLDREIGNI